MPMGRDTDLVAMLRGCTPVVTQGYLRRSGICVVLVACDGRVLEVAESGWDALGFGDASAIRGRPVWDLWPVEARPNLRKALTRARLGRASDLDVAPGDRADGADTPSIRLGIVPVRNAGGEVCGALLTFQTGF